MKKTYISGAVIMSTLASSGITPVHAQETNAEAMKTMANEVGVTQQYNSSVETALYNLRTITAKVEALKKEGKVTEAMLQKLVSDVATLDKAITNNNAEMTDEIAEAIIGAGLSLKGVELEGVDKAITQVQAILTKNGIGFNIRDAKKVAEVPKTKASADDIINQISNDIVSKAKAEGAEVTTKDSKGNTTYANTNVEATKPQATTVITAYTIYKNGKLLDSKDTIKEAITTARNLGNAEIKKDGKVVWSFTNEKKFTDVKKGQWYYDTILDMAGQGVVTGYTDGSFKPDKTISNAEYLTILVRETTGNKPQLGKDGLHWATNVINEAKRVGIVLENELPQSAYDKAVSRSDIAKYTSRAMTKVMKEQREMKEGIDNNITDSKAVNEDINGVYIKHLLSAGVVEGNGKGEYNPKASATRAESATIIRRIKNKDLRANVVVKQPTKPETPQVGNGVLNQNDPNRRIAKAGDTFIKADGTKVILKIGPSGVLGEGQQVAIDLGRIDRSGKPIVDGKLGADEHTLGQKYTVDKDGEGHFTLDWLKISTNSKPKVKGTKNGEVRNKYWEWDAEAPFGGEWTWIGPDYR